MISKSPVRRSIDRWEVLFRALRDLLATPTPERPCVRVWGHTDLAGEIERLKEKYRGDLKWTFPPAKEVVERIRTMGWLRSIELEPARAGKTTPRLYLVDMEAGQDDVVEQMELLQALKPAGILCYFSVLALHELTTQAAPFCHVAILQSPPSRPASPVPASEPARPNPERTERNPLGTALFRYQGIECYQTRRDRSLVPGIQTRVASARTWLRVTTLEQTLLDTLLHPVRCGGEAVVFEAWDRAKDRWNLDRLGEYLGKIDRLEMDRRVGSILAMLEVQPDSPRLTARLNAARARLAAEGQAAPELSLLQGFSYKNLDRIWRVRIP